MARTMVMRAMLTMRPDATANLKRRLQRLLRRRIAPSHNCERFVKQSTSNVVRTVRTQNRSRPHPGRIHGRESQMTRILKALGLALGAMATMVALAAPAQAATGQLTAGANPAIVTGPQVMGPTFDIGAG